MKRSKTIEFSKVALRLNTNDLGTRFDGASVREIIFASFNETDEFIFDFSGVETISLSFADECFAKLLVKYDFDNIKRKTTFRNTSPFIKATVTRAFKDRLSSTGRRLHSYRIESLKSRSIV